jgi:hypothetical protein
VKEWQRWEAMADDFGRMGDHRRESECLSMALDLLPPGHKDDKGRLRTRLEDTRGRALEEGPRPPSEGEGFDETLLEARESLGLEETKEAVMAVLRRRCTSIEGTSESGLVADMVDGSGLEEDLVREALEELLDEGRAYTVRPGQLMVDGIIGEPDIEMAVLAVLGDLATGGRGGSRTEVIEELVSRGFARDELEEAIDELEEGGRLDEGHKGQLRVALGVGEIEEVHHRLLAAVEEMDPDGKGVLDTRLERELTSRGMEIDEVREALDELVDDGDLVRDGGEVRIALPVMDDREARGLLLEVLRALSEDRAVPVPLMRALKASRSRGMRTTMFHRVLDDLVDGGRVWHDDDGLHMADAGRGREVLLEAVRELGHGRLGAPRSEVLATALVEGFGEVEAGEILDDLIDDGHVHDAGGGFLKPG